jgi:hypothetical protein
MPSRTALTPLERAVLAYIADTCSEDGAALRAQVAAARLRDRKNTGSGFFTYFDIDRAAPPTSERKPRDMRDGPFGKVGGAAHGMGFILWLKDGYADCLEGYCYANDETKGWDLENLSFELSASPPDPSP